MTSQLNRPQIDPRWVVVACYVAAFALLYWLIGNF